MSLLDTFALLFETNAGDAADDVEKLSDSLDGAQKSGTGAAQGIDAAAVSAEAGSESFSGLIKSAVGLVAAFVSVQAISSAVLSQALETDRVGKFTQALGVNIAELDAWGAAVKLNGGSADSFRGSVEALNGAMADIALGGGGDIAETLGRLGISALDSTGRIKEVTELLPQLADAFQNLSKRESVAFGKKLGLDQGTILLLQQGRSAVSQLVEQQRQLGGRTEEGYKASAAFNDEMSNTGRIFTGITDTANQTILPVLTGLLQGFQVVVAWVQEHKDVVVGFFVATAAVIAAIYLPAIKAAAVATIAATWPFLAIGAAIIAVGAAAGLLYEDIKAYLGGQESFVGSLAKKYEWFGKLLDGVIGGVRFLFREFSEFGSEMFDNLGRAVEFLGSIYASVFGAAGDNADEFGGRASAVVDVIIAAFQLLGSVISGVLGFIASPIETTAAAFEWLSGKATSAIGGMTDGIASAFKAMGDIILSVIEMLLSPIDTAKKAIGGIMELVPSLGDFTDGLSGAWGAVSGFFGDDDQDQAVVKLQRQTDVALATSVTANNNPILSGAGMSSRVSYVTQSNQFSTQVDARGMSREDAAAAYSEQRTREIAQAKGFLDDGVAY